MTGNLSIKNLSERFVSSDSSRRTQTSSSKDVSTAANLDSKKTEIVRLIADKLQIPELGVNLRRPRLHDHLTKSLEQFNATLVVGRTGTGKTSLVADFARRTQNRCVAWYKVEAADSDWAVFSSYLIECLNRHCSPQQSVDLREFIAHNSQSGEIASLTEVLGVWLAAAAIDKPMLIVLDDAHCVFDADWFTEFFHKLVPMLTSDVHLLMLSRALPSFPLWRMRSKQMLGVIDENLLQFNIEETSEMFDGYGLSASVALAAQQESFGRAAKLRRFAEVFNKQISN